MSSSPVRPLAVVAAALLYFALGALWYSPLLFVTPWLRFIGRTFDEIKLHGARPYPFALLAALIISYALARVLALANSAGARSGALTGLALGLALAVASAAPSYLFEMRPLGLLAINAGYPVVGMTLAGALLGAWPSRPQHSSPILHRPHTPT